MAITDRVYDYRDLSLWQYDLAQGLPKFIRSLPTRWSLVGFKYGTNSYFEAAIFHNDVKKELNFSPHGTDKNALRWMTTLVLALSGYKPSEYTWAERCMEQAMGGRQEKFPCRQPLIPPWVRSTSRR